MKKATYSGIPLCLFLFGSFLSCLFIGFSIWFVRLFITNPPPLGIVFSVVWVAIVGLTFFLPAVMWEFRLLFCYFTIVHIFEDKLIYIQPFKRKVEIPFENISFWGCVAYAPRSSSIFFCTLKEDNLLHYLEKNRKLCNRIFTKAHIDSLKTDREGLLRLAVGTYIKKHFYFPGNGIYILDYSSQKRLKMLTGVLKREGMLTGPWFVQIKATWRKYISG